MMMQWRVFAVMLLLTIFAAGVAGWAGVQYGLAQEQNHSDLDTIIHRDLDLTAEQDRKIHVLETRFAADRKMLQSEMRAANRDLARAIIEDHTYGPAARKAIGRVHTAMSALQEKTVQHVIAMREILTPEQTKKFDHIVEQALAAGTP